MVGRVSRRALAFGGVVGLAAVAGAEPAAMLPLTPGATWNFTVAKKTTISAGAQSIDTARSADVEETVSELSPLSTSGKPVFVIRQRVEERGANSVQASVVENALHVSSTPTGIWIHRVDLAGRASNALVTPRALFTDPPARGPLRGDVGPMRTALEIRQQTRETVRVPAGEFPDAYKVVAEGPVTGKLGQMPIRSGTAKVTTWFVRGVGLVREDRALDLAVVAPNGEAGRNVEESTKLLQRFRPTPAPSTAPNKDLGAGDPAEIPLPILR